MSDIIDVKITDSKQYKEPVKSEELFKDLPPLSNNKELPFNLLRNMMKSLNQREEFRNRDTKLADKLKKTAELKRLWKEAKKNKAPNTQELYELYKKYKEI